MYKKFTLKRGNNMDNVNACKKGYYSDTEGKCRITTSHARKLTKEWLDSKGFDYKVSARTISFADIARDYAVFVTVHKWKSNKSWDELRKHARKHGFHVTDW